MTGRDADGAAGDSGVEALVSALERAAADPSRRAEAVAALRVASLHVIGQWVPQESAHPGDPPGDDAATDDGGPGGSRAARIAQLRQDGQTIVPVFTAAAALEAFTGGESPSMSLDGETLFESCGDDATFVIDPGAAHSLTLGVAELVTDAGAPTQGEPAPDLATAADPGEPAAPPLDPTPILVAMRGALVDCPSVRAAHAGNLVTDGKARVVVGLDLDEGADPEPVVGRISAALQGVGPADASVDLVLLDRTPGPLTDALRRGAPFYRRGEDLP